MLNIEARLLTKLAIEKNLKNPLKRRKVDDNI
jgi:hypothetical protein